MKLQPGTLLQGGKYKIIKTLGQGGFGITYLAEQVALHRKVAVKEFFMKEFCARDESTSQVTLGTTDGSRDLVARFRSKFLREAQMIAGFDHPHIVKIHDVFEENGTAYYVMEFLDGDSLSERVKRNGPMPEPEAMKYIRQVGDALAYLHGQNCLHFDVKPSNILINKLGNAVLIDFGVSKHYDEGGGQTSSTPVGISRGYAPMEQYQQNEISTFTPATDIYALGATLYTLVTGLVPPSASEVNEDGLPQMPGVSEATQRAITQAMQSRRKDRPQSVAAFLELLDAKPVVKPEPEDDETVVPPQVPPQEPPKPVQKPKPEKPAKPAKAPKQAKPKSKLWLWALLGVLAVAGIVIIFSTWPAEEEIIDPDEFAKPLSGTSNGHEWVDLGLSVKWATTNVGADAPEADGDYFAWGETKPRERFTWENYRFRLSGNKDDDVILFRYNTDSRHGKVDNKITLDLSDDPAHASWGGNWRTPTMEEIQELFDKCVVVWTSIGNKNGFIVYSKVYDTTIFLPAAGRRSTTLTELNEYGYYWTSTLWDTFPNKAQVIQFHEPFFNCVADESRFYGFSVRPVIADIAESSEPEQAQEAVEEVEEMADAGSVKVTSTPSGASIWLDGKDTQQTTPTVLENLSSGKHTVRLVKAGYSEYKLSVTVKPGEETTLSKTLNPPGGTINGHDWVDMGLSVKWATTNVGASSPEGYGNYYAWGETSPKSSYDGENYKFRIQGVYRFTKYVTKSNISTQNFGEIDNKTRLELSDDAAYVNWGGSWRMPTHAEMKELWNRCQWKWTTEGGVNGCRVTSTITGNSIFLPAAGARRGRSEWNAPGKYGVYWSASLMKGQASSAIDCAFWENKQNDESWYPRSDGFTVRPVTK